MAVHCSVGTINFAVVQENQMGLELNGSHQILIYADGVDRG